MTSRFPRPRASAIAALLLSTIVTACGDSSATGPLAPPARRDTLTALPRALSTTEQQAVSASNTFAFSLMREVLASARAAENVVLSPFSGSVALGMVMNGANGATETGIRTALGWDASTASTAINGAYRDLSRMLGTLDSSVTLTSANAIWYRNGFQVEPAFLQTARDFFSATVQGADFSAPATLAAINDWASRNTNGRIPRVLDQINGEDMMFLLNALYFKGTWRTRFEASNTRQREFTGADGRAVQVPFMHRTIGTSRLSYGTDFNILELPYGNGAYVMDVIVPREGLSLADLTARLAGNGLSTALSTLRDRESVPIALPKFRITTNAQLRQPLSNLGMGQAFDCARADFTRLTSARNTCISFVKQDAMIEVNEEGTEAAAVTSIGIITVSAPAEFAVDRPFLFVIRERLSNTTYFVGAVRTLSAN
jgi:serine protease inhibitor